MSSSASPRCSRLPCALIATLLATLCSASAWGQSSLVAWGENWQGQASVPPGLGAGSPLTSSLAPALRERGIVES